MNAFKEIYTWVSEGSKVLDLGCGCGDLLQRLRSSKNARVQGVEIDISCIESCIEKGIDVMHGDIEEGLSIFMDRSFDFVILYESLQQIKNLKLALNEALRIGEKVIIQFPNFAYYRNRLSLFAKGKAPITNSLPYDWHNSPNLHYFSLKDFEIFCKNNNIDVVDKVCFFKNKRVNLLSNLFADRALVLIRRKEDE